MPTWVRQTERNGGERPELTTNEREHFKALEREVRELKRANEIRRKASAHFSGGGARPPTQVMVDFVDEHRDEHGVEPIGDVPPSLYEATWFDAQSSPGDATVV